MIRVEIEGRDLIEFYPGENGKKDEIRVLGCAALVSLIESYRQSNRPIQDWSLPKGSTHSEILVRELILKAKGEWNFPYSHDEICHCRAVRTLEVDRAIICGAHTAQTVSRLTSASTACGNCRFDVEAIIRYRLGE